MNPKDVSSWISQYLTNVQKHKDAQAQQYIENNIELLETNIDEFIGNCPFEYASEVIAILKAAGIEVTDVIQRSVERDIAMNELLRTGNMYIHDAGTLKWCEPKADWSKAYISYDLSAGEDYTWKGDKWCVKGTV